MITSNDRENKCNLQQVPIAKDANYSLNYYYLVLAKIKAKLDTNVLVLFLYLNYLISKA